MWTLRSKLCVCPLEQQGDIKAWRQLNIPMFFFCQFKLLVNRNDVIGVPPPLIIKEQVSVLFIFYIYLICTLEKASVVV